MIFSNCCNIEPLLQQARLQLKEASKIVKDMTALNVHCFPWLVKTSLDKLHDVCCIVLLLDNLLQLQRSLVVSKPCYCGWKSPRNWPLRQHETSFCKYLTWLSKPSVNNMKKKRIAHKGDMGS